MAGEKIVGVRAVGEALRAPGRINRIVCGKGGLAPGAKALVDAARAARVRVDFVPLEKLNVFAQGDEHQGIAAEISPVGYISLDACLAACPPTATLLALDQIQHPKNLGLLIRTAAGAGASGVLVTARRGALLDESVVRASAGHVLHVPIVACTNLAQAMRTAREAGFWVYGLDARGDQTVAEVNWPERSVIVVGNESKGLRPGVAKVCDGTVRIPLAEGVESLNAAVAAGIALFRATEGRV
jgi:23S rRNA (guanosine2251-2'-O)-methyltransferase